MFVGVSFFFPLQFSDVAEVAIIHLAKFGNIENMKAEKS
jgi:hypothetical protein